MSVFIGVPIMDDIEPQTAQAINQTIIALADRGRKVVLQQWLGDSLIANARNVLFGLFLQSGCDDYLMIDADVVFTPDDALRLLEHKVDFVAGVYRYKTAKEEYPVTLLPGEIWTTEEGLIGVRRAPMGFSRITRKGAERLVERANLPYRCHLAPEVQAHAVFQQPFNGKEIIGEDYFFCDLWMTLCGPIWVDPYLRLGHIGKHNFEGCLRDWLVNRNSPPKFELADLGQLFAAALNEDGVHIFKPEAAE